MISDHAIEVH